MRYPLHLQNLIEQLKGLPGVGSKSAERFAFQLLEWKEERLYNLSTALKEIPEKLKACNECGGICQESICPYCSDEKRRNSALCIVRSMKDIFAIESTGEFKGLYHVLKNLLSPLEGIGPEKLGLDHLKKRVEELAIKEVVIALDSTLEGDATALFLKEELAPLEVEVSRLAFGLPMGSSLDYVDGGTLAKALLGRGQF